MLLKRWAWSLLEPFEWLCVVYVALAQKVWRTLFRSLGQIRGSIGSQINKFLNEKGIQPLHCAPVTLLVFLITCSARAC